MKVEIRKATKDDCMDLAKLVTIVWNETYKGIVPDWFLEELKTNEPDRAKKTYDEYDENNNYKSSVALKFCVLRRFLHW